MTWYTSRNGLRQIGGDLPATNRSNYTATRFANMFLHKQARYLGKSSTRGPKSNQRSATTPKVGYSCP